MARTHLFSYVMERTQKKLTWMVLLSPTRLGEKMDESWKDLANLSNLEWRHMGSTGPSISWLRSGTEIITAVEKKSNQVSYLPNMSGNSQASYDLLNIH